MRDQMNLNPTISARPISADDTRTYLSVRATPDSELGVTVTIVGGVPFFIEPGKSWTPQPCITNAIIMIGAGQMLYASSRNYLTLPFEE